MCFLIRPATEVIGSVRGSRCVVDVRDPIIGVTELLKFINVVYPIACVEEYADEFSGLISGIRVRHAIRECHSHVSDQAVLEAIRIQHTRTIKSNESRHIMKSAHLCVLYCTINERILSGKCSADKSAYTECKGMTAT